MAADAAADDGDTDGSGVGVGVGGIVLAAGQTVAVGRPSPSQVALKDDFGSRSELHYYEPYKCSQGCLGLRFPII